MYMIGASLADPMSGDEVHQSGKGFGLGDRYVSHDGKEYVYVQADGALTGAGYVVTISEAYQAKMASTSNDDLGDLVGVATAAFADDDYGFVQVKGPASIRVAASAAANTQLNTTSTAGQIDDAVAGSNVNGIVLTTANGGAAGTAAGVLNYPTIGAAAA